MEKKFIITGNQVSARITDSEKDIYQPIINDFVWKTGKEITTGKELFFALLDYTVNAEKQKETEIENEKNSTENDLIERLQPAIDVFLEIKPEYADLDTETVLKTALSEALNNKISPEQFESMVFTALQSEINVFIENHPEYADLDTEKIIKTALTLPANTPIETPENKGLFVDLDDDQMEILSFISAFRHERRQVPLISPAQQLIELAFNKGTVHNYGGAYETGL